MRRDLLPLIIVLLILIVLPAGLFGYQASRSRADGIRVIDIVARVPEDGGFSPDHLELKIGETVRLRISSPDVVHGLSIPGLGVEVREILPGKPVEVDVTPERAGRYAFACIRWCSVDHWRMRGGIDVVGVEPSALVTDEPPLYQKLGLDLDAMRATPAVVPSEQPSADHGVALGHALPANLDDLAQRRSVVPVEAYQQMRADPKNVDLNDQQIWDLVAFAWLKDIKPEALASTQKTYAQECAACHGPEGKGNGPAGRNLPGRSKMDPMSPKGPADFTDAGRMLTASDAVLQGKILRGGMGTGMPEFGSLYKDDQLWALVAYVRTFAFKQPGR
jgi:mono/diheme cytochrome c family protein/plastocyanin